MANFLYPEIARWLLANEGEVIDRRGEVSNNLRQWVNNHTSMIVKHLRSFPAIIVDSDPETGEHSEDRYFNQLTEAEQIKLVKRSTFNLLTMSEAEFNSEVGIT